jgi:hypothetical protein
MPCKSSPIVVDGVRPPPKVVKRQRPSKLVVCPTCGHRHREPAECDDCAHSFRNPFDQLFCELGRKGTRICGKFKWDR